MTGEQEIFLDLRQAAAALGVAPGDFVRLAADAECPLAPGRKRGATTVFPLKGAGGVEHARKWRAELEGAAHSYAPLGVAELKALGVTLTALKMREIGAKLSLGRRRGPVQDVEGFVARARAKRAAQIPQEGPHDGPPEAPAAAAPADGGSRGQAQGAPPFPPRAPAPPRDFAPRSPEPPRAAAETPSRGGESMLDLSRLRRSMTEALTSAAEGQGVAANDTVLSAVLARIAAVAAETVAEHEARRAAERASTLSHVAGRLDTARTGS